MIRKALMGIFLVFLASATMVGAIMGAPRIKGLKNQNEPTPIPDVVTLWEEVTQDKPTEKSPETDTEIKEGTSTQAPKTEEGEKNGVTPEPTCDEAPTKTDPIPIPTLDPTPLIPETEEKARMKIKLYIASKKEYICIDLEEYITGVVLAEMSHNSPVEALKAQAVAARSYCLNRSTKTVKEHPESAVCNRSAHCMGYRSYDEIINKYGSKEGQKIWDKVYGIVMQTEGEYLSYKGGYISAMFHDSSYGCTQSAEDIYGFEKDYLVSVETPEKKTQSTRSIKDADMIKKLFELSSQIKDTSVPVGKIEYYESSGKCSSVEIYGQRFTALQLFTRLGLRSMDFDISYSDGEFIIVCRGFGHGMGMSQKGAKAYAQMGLGYRQILLHYYSGCSIDRL